MEQYSIHASLACPVGIAAKRMDTRNPLRTFLQRIPQCIHGSSCLICCWEWTGPRHASGYGITRKIMLNGKIEYVPHRIAWILAQQRYIPIDMEIGHSCDNRACCNPQHLWLCTHAENMQDMARKGRPRRSSSPEWIHPHAKLTSHQIHHIWRLRIVERKLQREIAEEVGVTQATISYILHQKTWKHLGIAAFFPEE